MLWTDTWEQVVTSLLLFQKKSCVFSAGAILWHSHIKLKHIFIVEITLPISQLITNIIAKGMNGLLLLPPLEFTYPLCSLGEQCAEEVKEILKGEEECISFKSKDVQLNPNGLVSLWFIMYDTLHVGVSMHPVPPTSTIK